MFLHAIIISHILHIRNWYSKIYSLWNITNSFQDKMYQVLFILVLFSRKWSSHYFLSSRTEISMLTFRYSLFVFFLIIPVVVSIVDISQCSKDIFSNPLASYFLRLKSIILYEKMRQIIHMLSGDWDFWPVQKVYLA